MSKPELNESDKQAFIDALNDFGVIFGRDITPELLNVYWRHLSKKMDRMGFDFAVGWIHDHERYFPAPSAFIRGERARWGVAG